AIVVCSLLASCENGRPRAAAAHTVARNARTRSTLNIYAATGANELAPAAARAHPLVYVPNSRSANVSVIDPTTYQVVRTFHTGALPQHVVPSYDMSRLWVLNNDANTITPIDPV